ncbi:HpcH/HpaI aldolase family protein [Phytohabitans suffuscus]|uniref:2,4-dihydroxyhept-2-ene-1,7-dioic acid aldolase n=1 Tax=Phytohabitans suffuscus TaxID=624315 RepID=A0A6F8YU59_9ACTN|nr:aldolase/citrate lyase family protein [Phytohabitans suffuscus]BCB89609.1 2,4-dihydroxyhept-2-ene-1,7-dioic acid aldolase [Phytohabitans suffuscus]
MLTGSDPSRPSAGAWCGLGDPGATEILHSAGFDWVCLDAQHGAWSDRGIVRALRQLPPGGPQTAVRVAANTPAAIGRALDAGATAVIVPMVQDPRAAASAAASCRYPPAGDRSWGPMPALWGRRVPTPREANRAVGCAVMIETPYAVERVDRIAAVDGVDMVFVGPLDLALASGVSVEALLADTGPTAPLRQIVTACTARGVRVGAFAGSASRSAALAAAGFHAIAVATDSGLLANAAARTLEAWRGPGEPAARQEEPGGPGGG